MTVRKKRLAVLVTVSAAVLFIAALAGIFFFRTIHQPVSNFKECAAQGYPIMESYPRKCVSPDGKIFTEDLENVPEKMSVNVYFGKYSPDSDMDVCTTVYPVERTIARTSGVAKAAIKELLKGPLETERDMGFFTSINDGVSLNRISIVGGVAEVDFSGAIEKGVGGSCRVLAIRKQIETTLKQFPSVSKVIISVNGRAEDILQP